jgi:hypothetical protein
MIIYVIEHRNMREGLDTIKRSVRCVEQKTVMINKL